MIKGIIKHDLVDPIILQNSGYNEAQFIDFKMRDYELSSLVEDEERRYNKNDPNIKHDEEEV